MVQVSIDVEAANGVVAGLRGVVDAVKDEWSDVAMAARRALCSTSALQGLSDPLDEVSRLAGELATRVELAVVYNTGDKGQLPTGNVLTYEVSDDTLEAVKAQLGIEIAEGIQDLAPSGTLASRADVERFEYYTGLLEKYSADALVTDALFTELGPEGVVQVPIMLKNFADDYQRDLPDGDPMWDEDTSSIERISQLQQQFMESFGAGLAGSTNSDAFRSANPDFAGDLAAAATAIPNGQGWGLSQVLRFGDYEAGFLTSLGTELYAWEKDQFGPVWGPQLSSTVMDWRLGTEDNGAHFDPFVGLFEAMGRTPQASLDFFNPDGGGVQAQERSEYFITDRRWKADDFNALGLALDAAATGFGGSSAPVDLQERAAWMASATIHYLAEREPGWMNGPRIGDAGKDSLAHILSTYIVDVDRVANGEGLDDALSTSSPRPMFPWDDGARVSAGFDIDDLRAVLGEVLTDDAAMTQVAEATARFNAFRMNAAVQAWNADPQDASFVDGSVQTSAVLSGFVLGNLERASEAAGRSVDERNKAYLDIASSVVGLVPTGGGFTSFVAKQALSAGKNALSGALTGHESAADAAAFDAQVRTLEDLNSAMAVALLGSERVTDFQRADQDEVPYSWFDSTGAFVPSALEDQATFEEFERWTTGGGGGERITSNLPDLNTMYENGIERGKGSD